MIGYVGVIEYVGEVVWKKRLSGRWFEMILFGGTSIHIFKILWGAMD